jgi:two-component system, response regulator / RNA-binding antiterminator
MAPGTPLRLVVITMSAQLPDPADDHDWAEASRLGGLMRGLEAAGHRVEALLPADPSLTERLSTLAPDVVIVDAESGARDAIEHVVVATRDAPRPIVLFTEEHDPDHMREALAAGVVAYVVAGLAAERVWPVLDVAVARFEHERDLRRQLADAREQLAAQDLVAQAKQLLMQRHGIDEPQAHARLRTASMNRGVPMREIARQMVEMSRWLA